MVVNPDGSTSVGIEDIRTHLDALLGLGGSMVASNSGPVVNGELALILAEWTITPPSGQDPIRGRSAEVLRRQGDGSWRYLIDDPTTGSH